jgi:hypothetical protein
VGACDIVRLDCRPEAIEALAGGLERFGALEGEPQWLVSAVWLSTATSDYIATSSTRVLQDGYIARPLVIDRTEDFISKLRSDLPDIAGRLIARQNGLRLPEPITPAAPTGLQCRPEGDYSTRILIRVSARVTTHRVACALLFEFASGRLLVGTDPGMLAMVVSSDPALIDRYASACEALSPEDYLDRYAC